MSKCKAKKSTKGIITPKHKLIADLYEKGKTMTEIGNEVGYNKSTISVIINSKIVQDYIKANRKSWDDLAKSMRYRLMKKVEEQIKTGRIEETTYYDKKGKKTSKVISKKPFSMKEFMDLCRLTGIYTSTLTVNKGDSKKDDNQAYEDVLEHLETLKKEDKK